MDTSKLARDLSLNSKATTAISIRVAAVTSKGFAVAN